MAHRPKITITGFPILRHLSLSKTPSQQMQLHKLTEGHA